MIAEGTVTEDYVQMAWERFQAFLKSKSHINNELVSHKKD